MENTDKNSMEKIVRSLVGQYGKELYLPENELRFKGLLFDFASDFSRELKTLKIVLAERIPAKLLTCDDKDDDEKSRTLQYCKDTLVDEVGLMEERVVQGLNILADGLGWKVKLGEKQAEKTRKTVEKEKVYAESEPEKEKYKKLVRDTLDRLPFYRHRYGGLISKYYHADTVNIGYSEDIDGNKFCETLRSCFSAKNKKSLALNDDIKKFINKYLGKVPLKAGELYLMIGGIGNYFHTDISFAGVILVNGTFPLTYKLVDGFTDFDIYRHFTDRLLNK